MSVGNLINYILVTMYGIIDLGHLCEFVLG